MSRPSLPGRPALFACLSPLSQPALELLVGDSLRPMSVRIAGTASRRIAGTASRRIAGTASRLGRASGGGAGAVVQALCDVARVASCRVCFGGGLFLARASAVHELPHARSDLLVEELGPLLRRVGRRGARRGGDDRHQHLLEQPTAEALALAQVRLHVHVVFSCPIVSRRRRGKEAPCRQRQRRQALRRPRRPSPLSSSSREALRPPLLRSRLSSSPRRPSPGAPSTRRAPSASG